MQKIDCIYIINLKKEKSRLKQTLLLLADEDIHIPIKIFEATHWKSEFFEKGYITICYRHLLVRVCHPILLRPIMKPTHRMNNGVVDTFAEELPMPIPHVRIRVSSWTGDC